MKTRSMLPFSRQHLGHEPGDAVLRRRGGEVLEQHRADAAALVRVLDHERDLGVRRVRRRAARSGRPR